MTHQADDFEDSISSASPTTVDIAIEPWAAMITYWNEQVSGFRRIIWSKTPDTFVREASKTLADFAILLNEHFAEDVNCSDIFLLFEDEDESAAEKDWSWLDVEERLKAIPEEALEEVSSNAFSDLTESEWYKPISFVNDVYPDSSGVWIDFSAPLSGFLDRLLKFEADDFSSYLDLTDKGAIYLGKLAVLSRLKWTGTIPIEQWKAANEMFEQFNDWNSDLNSLD